MYVMEQTAYTKELLSTVCGKNNSFILSFVEMVSSYQVQTNPVLLISPWIKTFISSITDQFNEVCELVISKAESDVETSTCKHVTCACYRLVLLK